MHLLLCNYKWTWTSFITFESDFSGYVNVEEMHFPVSLDELPLRVPNGQSVVEFVSVSLWD